MRSFSISYLLLALLAVSLASGKLLHEHSSSSSSGTGTVAHQAATCPSDFALTIDRLELIYKLF